MSHPRELRLLVYDATGHGRPLVQPFLTASWVLGALLYRALGRIDLAFGARSWPEALRWLSIAGSQPRAPASTAGQPITELQFWGHGRAGCVLIGQESLDTKAVVPRGSANPLHADLLAVRARLQPDSRIWLRTCSAFAGAAGQRFARALSEFFGCRIAGHTHVIAVWQSGLHSVRPGEVPDWPEAEGGAAGGARSSPGAPNTVTFLHGKIPAGW